MIYKLKLICFTTLALMFIFIFVPYDKYTGYQPTAGMSLVASIMIA
jgi:hypothetical protein